VVTLHAAALPGGGARVEVADTGTGIPAENLPRIFEPYFTTKQFGEEIRGFGLGLAIAEKIAHLHRGQLRVSSTVGHGTTVSLELPAGPVSDAALAVEPAAPGAALG
jgi:signal transduction histidine kinase